MTANRKFPAQVGGVRVVYPKLGPGEVVCPVCDYPAVPVPNNPGLYHHPGRYFNCRGSIPLLLMEVPGWPTFPPVTPW
jgi:hypothetical protein